MNDAFFAGLMFQIESVICDADRTTELELNDSHIKSCLNKAKLLARKKVPKVLPKTERDRFILQLAEDINAIRQDLRESPSQNSLSKDGTIISVADWILAIKAVEGSIKNHTMTGTRCYLDYLGGFIAEAHGKNPNVNNDKKTKWWKRIFK